MLFLPLYTLLLEESLCSCVEGLLCSGYGSFLVGQSHVPTLEVGEEIPCVADDPVRIVWSGELQFLKGRDAGHTKSNWCPLQQHSDEIEGREEKKKKEKGENIVDFRENIFSPTAIKEKVIGQC